LQAEIFLPRKGRWKNLIGDEAVARDASIDLGPLTKKVPVVVLALEN
jgi:hypothetical protein